MCYSFLDGGCLCLLTWYLIIACNLSESMKEYNKMSLDASVVKKSFNNICHRQLNISEITARKQIEKHYRLLNIMRLLFAIAVILQFISSADLPEFNQFCSTSDNMSNKEAQIKYILWFFQRYIIYILITIIIYQTALAYKYFGYRNLPTYFLSFNTLLCL